VCLHTKPKSSHHNKVSIRVITSFISFRVFFWRDRDPEIQTAVFNPHHHEFDTALLECADSLFSRSFPPFHVAHVNQPLSGTSQGVFKLDYLHTSLPSFRTTRWIFFLRILLNSQCHVLSKPTQVPLQILNASLLRDLR
jgi:hypothetical protein